MKQPKQWAKDNESKEKKVTKACSYFSTSSQLRCVDSDICGYADRRTHMWVEEEGSVSLYCPGNHQVCCYHPEPESSTSSEATTPFTTSVSTMSTTQFTSSTTTKTTTSLTIATTVKSTTISTSTSTTTIKTTTNQEGRVLTTCKASGSWSGVAMYDNWCSTNCLHEPPNCPPDICQCYKHNTQQQRRCRAAGVWTGNQAVTAWCGNNCPGFCPASHCTCD